MASSGGSVLSHHITQYHHAPPDEVASLGSSATRSHQQTNQGFRSYGTLPLDLSDWMMDPLSFQSRPAMSVPQSVEPLSGGKKGDPGTAVIATPPVTPQLVDSDSSHQTDDYSPSPSDTTKPPYDYKTLVAMALESGGNGGMTICGIYNHILTTYPYYRSEHAPPTWRSRIRNVLTVNDCFKRVPDPKGGRKGKWVLQRPDSSSGDSGLKSPHSIRNDKSPKIMRRSASNMVLTPNELQSDSDCQSAPVSGKDREFSFDEEDVRNIDERVAARSTYFAPQPTLSGLNSISQYGLAFSNPVLTLSAVDVAGARALSAASMEMVDQLAMELKQECSMLTKARSNTRNPAPIA